MAGVSLKEGDTFPLSVQVENILGNCTQMNSSLVVISEFPLWVHMTLYDTLIYVFECMIYCLLTYVGIYKRVCERVYGCYIHACTNFNIS